MLFEIMKHIRNYFATDVFEDGTFKIEDGTISLPFVSEGQYILIEDSIFNDGVYKYPVTGLTDEEFEGAITVLAPPKEFLSLVENIEEFKNKNDSCSSMQSESFGGYSYTRATNSNGQLAGWQDIFKQQLNVWRKL